METTKHTPGPWQVERRWVKEREIVPRITCAPDEDRGCGWIADTIGAPYLGHESTLPNAYLIAAAPAMLAKLKKVVEWLNRCADKSEHYAKTTTQFLSLAESYEKEAKNFRATAADISKVIAQAEGK